MHHLVFILISGIWSTSFLMMKRAEPVVGGIGVGFVRIATGAAVLGLLFYVSKQKWPFKRRDIAPLMAIAAVANAWPYWCDHAKVAH